MTVAIRPVVQRSVSKSQVVAPRRRRRGSCRCCAVVNFGGRPGAGFAVKAWRPRRRTASRQRITELCEHPSRRATSVTEAPAFSSSIPRRRRRSSSSGLPGGRMPQEYRARHQMSITYAHVNNNDVLTLDVAVLAQSLEKALDQKRSALARADGQKTDPGYFRGLLAGRLAARQKAETGQGHAALQELATAIAVHAGCPGPRVSRAAHYDAREASSCGRVKLESSSAGRRAPSALAFLR